MTFVEVSLALSAATALALLVMFTPAFVELKKPRDVGPRLIGNYFTRSILGNLNLPLQNMEDDSHCGVLSVRVLNLFGFPNLEGGFI
ncbi:MAG: hypothetical protein NWE92_03890 [Candidatus Bathyarchaeota archaeon]|nr:hypothetical protein [Candidatus Bathyarchaeota archaeon]